MAAATKALGFLKKHITRGAAVDSADPSQMLECDALKLDFEHQHCEFNAETDLAFPHPLIKKT